MTDRLVGARISPTRWNGNLLLLSALAMEVCSGQPRSNKMAYILNSAELGQPQLGLSRSSHTAEALESAKTL